jgi:hypothetical protein
MAAMLAHDIIIGAVFYVSTVIVILNLIGWLINIIGCLVASQAGWLAGRLPGFTITITPVSRSNICVAITYVLRISNFSRAKICGALHLWCAPVARDQE